jgi:hypothetical protein
MSLGGRKEYTCTHPETLFSLSKTWRGDVGLTMSQPIDAPMRTEQVAIQITAGMKSHDPSGCCAVRAFKFHFNSYREALDVGRVRRAIIVKHMAECDP